MDMSQVSDFLGKLSFWFFLMGVFLVISRMPTPGMKMVNKKKYYEEKARLDNIISEFNDLSLKDKILVLSGRYFFIYYYYRNDLVVLFTVLGAILIRSISIITEG